jgi:hypothetical protein
MMFSGAKIVERIQSSYAPPCLVGAVLLGCDKLDWILVGEHS